jgi:hypothetical protein
MEEAESSSPHTTTDETPATSIEGDEKEKGQASEDGLIRTGKRGRPRKPKGTCSTEQCTEIEMCKGLCRKCYQRSYVQLRKINGGALSKSRGSKSRSSSRKSKSKSKRSGRGPWAYEDELLETPYVVELTQSRGYECHTCSKEIDVADLRLGVLRSASKTAVRWCHASCFDPPGDFKVRYLYGRDALRSRYKRTLKELFPSRRKHHHGKHRRSSKSRSSGSRSRSRSRSRSGRKRHRRRAYSSSSASSSDVADDELDDELDDDADSARSDSDDDSEVEAEQESSSDSDSGTAANILNVAYQQQHQQQQAVGYIQQQQQQQQLLLLQQQQQLLEQQLQQHQQQQPGYANYARKRDHASSVYNATTGDGRDSKRQRSQYLA